MSLDVKIAEGRRQLNTFTRKEPFLSYNSVLQPQKRRTIELNTEAVKRPTDIRHPCAVYTQHTPWIGHAARLSVMSTSIYELLRTESLHCFLTSHLIFELVAQHLK